MAGRELRDHPDLLETEENLDRLVQLGREDSLDPQDQLDLEVKLV